MGEEFVHLHVASRYSLRYGTASPLALARAAAAAGLPALALTDRDGLYGAYKHALACASVGIAPILGASLAASTSEDEAAPAGPGASPPSGRGRVTVLAGGKAGWAGLCRLVGAGRPVGPDEVPPDTVTMLGQESDVGQAVADRRYDHAAAVLCRWAARAEVVVEITDHQRRGDASHARRMLDLARHAGVPAVLTNAVRYLDPADSALAQVIDATRRGVPLGTPGLRQHNGRAHLASPSEMTRIAVRIAGDGARDLLAATAALARRCVLDPKTDLGIGARHLPDLHVAADLRFVCEQALLISYRGRDANRARSRLEHELGIIAATDLAPYFLTVSDVVRRIKAAGIRCSIRGSGAGSLVNHLLGISAIDPLDYGLIMERFLSHTRETLPDIDLDVESARRIEAYRIILDAYGEDRCATVCMLETYRARSAIRDVAAAFGLPRPEIDAIAKAFPHIRASHIGTALTELPELRQSNLNIRQLAGLFRLAERLDGLPRHAAMHPCGVLLSDATLTGRTPITRSAADNLPLSQLDKDDAETAGVIKLDVLGVRMQSAMAYTLSQIEAPPDLDTLPRDDEETFALIRDARTIGCFQIESPGQRELVSKVAPRRFDDLIAEISLFRPGPVNSDMITPFLRVRHDREPASYPDERLHDALAETGGVVVYHEQVMRIIDTMTGCGLAEADRIRRRLPDPAVASWFTERATERGYLPQAVDRVWQVLAAFGAFGFCKAHAAAFAVPVYQSAWLKARHPAAFYAGILTHDPGMYPKRVILGDARRAGIRVLGPDVSTSQRSWVITKVASSPALLTSLHEVKGMS
ncbi:MAG TPA: DNA polymerase III subunit alpha, partial [Streptosporangiaceae bacterium]|nr:DNA polymerase III subunit alpha [Streptosporangiaceae bacterium]